MTFHHGSRCAAAIAAFALASMPFVPRAHAGAGADLLYGVTETGQLVSFLSNQPDTFLNGVAIQGLQANETVVGIDFRPQTGELFAVGSFSNLYTINVNTGMVSLVGSGPFANTLNGSAFGYDFNPTIDRSRVVSNARQNIVLNPFDGTSTGATNLFYGPGDPNEGVNPNVVHTAYTNSFRGATTTVQYSIDSGLDMVATLANNAGTLATVGSLGVDISDIGGFDIAATGRAWGAFFSIDDGRSGLYRVNLNTGKARFIGEFHGGSTLTALSAVTPVPAPAAACLLGFASLLGRRSRRR